MSTFVRRALAAAALCASAASASAMQWQLQSFSYGMANEPATGTFFYDGVSFSDWNIRTPFSVDYVGFEYTTANSRIDMVGDGFIILGLNYSADKCQLRNDAPPTGFTTWCMQISLPGVFDGSSVTGSFNEYRTTYGGYAEGRAYGGTYAPIPEPATAAMLLAGVGLVGWTARRRRRA